MAATNSRVTERDEIAECLVHETMKKTIVFLVHETMKKTSVPVDIADERGWRLSTGT